jgi:hypothetical protein
MIAVAAALLAATGGRAVAAKGGNRTAATIVFDDLAGDAIRSDGLGAYDGSISRRGGTLVVDTRDRSLTFDFGWAESPHEIPDVTITVSSLDEATATADFEFRWEDLYSRGEAADEWIVTMSVSVTRSGDTYYLEPVSDAEVWARDHHRGPFRSDHASGPEWVLADIVDLPWGAVVSP